MALERVDPMIRKVRIRQQDERKHGRNQQCNHLLSKEGFKVDNVSLSVGTLRMIEILLQTLEPRPCCVYTRRVQDLQLHPIPNDCVPCNDRK